MKNTRAKTILTDDAGKPTHVVLPYIEYLSLIGDDAEDEALGRIADKRRGEQTLPDTVVSRLLDRDNAVKVLREHRGMTQAALAKVIGSSTPYVSQLETGIRKPGRELLIKLSKALKVPLDLLIQD